MKAGTPASAHDGRTVFVTGYPGFIGKALVRTLLEQELHTRVLVLVQPRFEEAARQSLDALGPQKAERAQVIAGDVVDMHLGLSSGEYMDVAAQVTDVFHLAAVNALGVSSDVVFRVNVEGTLNVLELARDIKNLRRFNFFSSCYVSGNRIGVITEEELEMGQGFNNPYEESKFQAEREVRRWAKRIPTSIYRPAIVVGDSGTGEVDRLDTVYYMAIMLVNSPLNLPLPGDGVAPLNITPVDFVVKAALRLSWDKRAEGLTFHLVDPNPLSSRKVFEIVAERAGKKLPRMRVSPRMFRMITRVPGLERLTRQPLQALNYVNHLAIYNCTNTLRLLDGSGIMCPPFESYVDNLMSFVRRHYREKKKEEAESKLHDPLEGEPNWTAGEAALLGK
ncbi:MAG: Linear gramicidin synthase subunit D [Myxococcota bacterium]|nr:Linear gramicidin synthase subunit D [Myxococcota bacterium]